MADDAENEEEEEEVVPEELIALTDDAFGLRTYRYAPPVQPFDGAEDEAQATWRASSRRARGASTACANGAGEPRRHREGPGGEGAESDYAKKRSALGRDRAAPAPSTAT